MVAVVGIAGVLLSGCSSSSKGENTTATGGNGSAATSGSSGGGSSTLTMVVQPSGPLTRNFNPFNPNNAGMIQGTQAFVYEPLVQFNLAKTGQEYPWLAKSYDWSSDGKTLTLHLQSGVTWSDGKPFSASDVAFTFNLLRKFPALNTSGIKAVSATAKDPTTAVLTFDHASFVDFYYIASVGIVPEHIWSGIADPSTFADPNPVGTGPYLLTSFNQQGWEMTKNPHYWQAGKPTISNIRVPIFNSAPSATLALGQGTVDWAGLFVNNIDTVFAAKDKQHNTYWQPGYSTVTIIPNLEQGKPLADVAVRQAVSAALDRTQISKAATQGQAPPAASATGLVLPAQETYLTDATKQYALTPDVAKAKSILDGAGYKMGGDGYYQTPAGGDLAFSLEQPSNYADFMTDAQVASQQLKAAGIKVTVSGVSVQKYTSDITNGTFDAAIHVGVSGTSPYYQYNYWLNSAFSAPAGKPAISNFSRWEDPATDKLLTQYASTNDPKVQATAIDGIAQVMATKLPVIPLLYGAAWAQMNTKKFTGYPTADNPYMLGWPVSPSSEYTVLQLKPAAG
ncbi:ABC transporter substrate-binding protein [Nakamurella endophytica]|uniref:Peptide ABC transporter substrate-binding protein n=1 Tax=Nakamurella endophytica TaxID=1748367 RepID=A0A917STP4_9ACTN|nr:ABC transporter substrate-binding protein [Nakamurella endophytica]GGL94467.1 peptide ABC transporter substrate-binding protein [Nakamurella endophytica]